MEEKPKATKLKRNSAPAKNDFNKKSASFRKLSPKNKTNNSGGYSSKKKHR
jgi:23S rRNA pseudouridine2604 synthase